MKFDIVVANPHFPWINGGQRMLVLINLGVSTVVYPKEQSDYAFVIIWSRREWIRPCGCHCTSWCVIQRLALRALYVRNLLRKTFLDAVIGLPPIVLWSKYSCSCSRLQKGRKTKDLLFIDASLSLKKTNSKQAPSGGYRKNHKDV